MWMWTSVKADRLTLETLFETLYYKKTLEYNGKVTNEKTLGYSDKRTGLGEETFDTLYKLLKKRQI